MMEDLEAYFYFQNAPLKSQATLRESRDHLLIKSFHQITLQESKTSKGKILYSWVVLPATPEDMQELIRLVKSKHKDQEPISEEEILTFYQHHLYYKNIRDIVTNFGSEQKMPNFEAITDGSSPSQHKYTRKKALSTVFNDQDQALLPLRGTVGPFPGNQNTIYELSNEEYSRGGYSSTKKPLPYPVAGSKLKLPDDVQSFTEEEDSILRQQPTHLDYRSHQVNKSAMGFQNSMSGAFPGGGDYNPDEGEPTMRLSEVIPKGGGNSLLVSTDSPFQRFGNQIGTSIKNMFGGFGSLLFKKGDEEGERVGRQAEPQMSGAMRSRSIQSMHMNTKVEVMKVGPAPQQIIEKAQSRNQKKIEGQMSSQSMILQSTNKQTQSKQKKPSSKPLHLPPPKSHTSLGLTVNSRQPQHHYLKTHSATPTHQDLKLQEPQSFINFLRDSFSLLKAEPPPQLILQNVKDFDRSSGGNEDVNLDDDEDFLYRTGDAQGTTERVSGFEKVQYRAARVESPDFMAHKRKLFAGGK